MNITKRVLTEQTAPNFPETLSKSINKQYGIGLKQKYSQDELIKIIHDTYVQFMVTIGYDKAKALKLFSNHQVRVWDKYTIQANAESSIDLMERAAIACTELILNTYPNKNEILVFCGCGNNGGDGLAISRLLAEQGKRITTFTVMHADKQSDDFIENEKRLKLRNAVKVFEIFEPKDLPLLNGNELIVDAIFGTGLNKQIIGIAADTINFINESKQTVVSIDIPSGLFADKSSKENTCIVKAHNTICFQVPKLAYLFPENAQFVGKWSIVDIGLSNASTAQVK
jgi:NAD(P)H-hydrate epimerase